MRGPGQVVRASAIHDPWLSRRNADDHDRRVNLERQLRLSEREAEAFRLVGAERAAKHWRSRAARLAARLNRL
jgi:hypothetical protein